MSEPQSSDERIIEIIGDRGLRLALGPGSTRLKTAEEVLKALRAAGFVPREPTQKMLGASGQYSRNRAAEIWWRMLEARL